MNPNLYQLSNISKSNNYSNNYQNNYEDDEDEEVIINKNSPDFIEFKSNVQEWLTIDDDIITLQKAIKDIKAKKNELTPKIMKFMDDYKINDLNTNNGKLRFTKSLYTKPLNKQFLIAKLGDFFRDFNKGEKAASFILENRDKEEKTQLKRVAVKKDKQFNI